MVCTISCWCTPSRGALLQVTCCLQPTCDARTALVGLLRTFVTPRPWINTRRRLQATHPLAQQHTQAFLRPAELATSPDHVQCQQFARRAILGRMLQRSLSTRASSLATGTFGARPGCSDTSPASPWISNGRLYKPGAPHRTFSRARRFQRSRLDSGATYCRSSKKYTSASLRGLDLSG